MDNVTSITPFQDRGHDPAPSDETDARATDACRRSGILAGARWPLALVPHVDEREPPDEWAGDPGCAAARAPYRSRIPVRSLNRILIVPVREIVRLEAEDNYVRIWASRPYLEKETLTGLLSRLDPAMFLRIHRSHAVNVDVVRELRPQPHGEFEILLADRTALVSGRSYRRRILDAFGLRRVIDGP